MTWAHQQLELPTSASPREVKRAYAQRLKQTRPQDDAEGFQRLKAAYDCAMQWATNQEESTQAPQAFGGMSDQAPDWQTAMDEGEHVKLEAVFAPTKVAEPPLSSETLAPAPTPIENNPRPSTSQVSEPGTHGHEFLLTSPPARSTPYEVAEQLLHTAGSEQFPKAEAFSHWLQDHPDFWLLTFKSEVATALPWALHRFESPLSAEHLEAIWAFFGLNQISTSEGSRSTLVFQEKKRHLNAMWLTTPAGYQTLLKKWTFDAGHAPDRIEAFKNNFPILQQEPGFAKSILMSFKWNHVKKMAEIARWIETQVSSTTSPGLNMKQIQLWKKMGNPHQYSHERMILTLVQSAAIWLLPVFLFILTQLPKPFSAYNINRIVNLFEACSIFATIFFVAKMTWSSILSWHITSVQNLGQMAWLKFAIVSTIMASSILTAGESGYIKLFQFLSTTYTLFSIWISFLTYEKFSRETKLSLSTAVFLSMLLFMFFSGMTTTSLTILYSTWLISFFFAFRSFGEFKNQMLPS